MRGSAPFAPLRARRAACQGSVTSPVDPLEQEEALPLHAPPASEGTPSDTSSRTLFGLGLRAPESRAASRRPRSLAPLDPSAQGGLAPLIALSPSSRAGVLR